MDECDEYTNIECLDECFLCKIRYSENEKLNLRNSQIHLCDYHFQMVTKDCIASGVEIK